jgi:transcriptional regulator with XRE-family HTH domain
LGATQGAPGGGGLHQEELATIAGLSVHAASALERGERRRPHVETVRALSAALDLTGPARDAFLGSARAVPPTTASDELSRAALPVPLTVLIGRDADIDALRQWLGDRVLGLITLIGRSREDFRRLGVLPGLLPIDAAETVLAGHEDVSHGGVEVLRLVGGLIDKSLLQRSETSVVATCPLYLMLDTMRASATHELDAGG